MSRIKLPQAAPAALALLLLGSVPALTQDEAAAPAPEEPAPAAAAPEVAPTPDETKEDPGDEAAEDPAGDDGAEKEAPAARPRAPSAAEGDSAEGDSAEGDSAAGDTSPPAAPGEPKKASPRDRRLDVDDEEPSRVRPRRRRPAPQSTSLIERIGPLPAWYTDRPWRVRARPTFTGWWNLDSSLQALRAQPSVGLGGVALEAEWTAIADLVVSGELGYAGGHYQSKVFRSLDTRMQLHMFSLGVGAGYRFFDIVTPYVRIGASYSLLEAVIRSSDAAYGGWDLFTPGVYGYGGVELALPRRFVPLRLLSPGLFAEVGYQHLGDFEPETPPDEDALTEQRVSPLGTLHLGGPAFRVGLVLSF